MTTLTEGKHDGEGIGLAFDTNFSSDAVTVLSGQNLAAMAVVGAVPSGTSASAAKSGGNTGTGTLTLDSTTPILPRVKEGVYTVRCIAAATNNGTFRIEDPDGIVLGDIVMAGGAGTWAEQIKFALADGGTDFIVGDGFDVTISALTEKVVEYNPAGTNGSQIVKGILRGAVNATSADTPGVVIARGPIEINANDITWKSGMTTAQKTTAKAALLAKGIRCL